MLWKQLFGFTLFPMGDTYEEKHPGTDCVPLWRLWLGLGHMLTDVPSSISFQHRDTPDNNADTPFEFTEENKKVTACYM